MRSGALDVRTLASPLSYPRVGIVVPKYRHTVVKRNTLRRRLRELVRTMLLRSIPAQDVLLRANPAAYTLSFAALAAELHAVEARLRGAGG